MSDTKEASKEKDTADSSTKAKDESDKKKDELTKEQQTAFEETRRGLPLKVEVQTLDFEHFKNRYATDDGLSIIEVLQGHADIFHEIRQGNHRRTGTKQAPPSVELKQDGETWIQRVRLQSPELLLLLSRLTGHGNSWGQAGARTFYRPFPTMNYYLPRMKECLAILEAHWAKAEGEENTAVATSSPVKPRTGGSGKDIPKTEEEDFRPWKPAEAVTGPVADSLTALQHIRKYIEFVEGEITPHWEHAAGTTTRKVRFHDLWMFYQPGELVYVPAVPESSAREQVWPKSANMAQTVWRLHAIYKQPHKSSYQCDIPAIDEDQNLILWCYFIDFNGTGYEPYAQEFYIPSYEGYKDITTIQAYPIRFLQEGDELVESKRKLGKCFHQNLTEKHLYYDGWTLTHEPTDPQSTDIGVNAEYVNGQVMVDFSEGHKWHGDLGRKSQINLQLWRRLGWTTEEDPLPIHHYVLKDNGSVDLIGKVQDTMQLEESIVGTISDRDFETNTFLQAWKKGTVRELDDDNIMLLPRRVVAYAFRERRFLRLDVEYLTTIPPYDGAFDDLEIDPSHKRMVRALVKMHFGKQALHLDLVRGKGAGLVILLHGAPGVGKTATAEAVAQTNRKPLFAITCGDLGFVPELVEENLKRIFRLAYRWDCVLLLDEADVFLSRRDTADVKRNALVSVFLRVLEYYSGILFLTTNRVGLLDEAFKSRIHLSLLYRPLTRDQTLSIFKTNIRKLREAELGPHEQQPTDPDVSPHLEVDEASILDYAAWHYDNDEEHRWNGRQIRNAFQIAYSFAHFDMQPSESESPKKLNLPGTQAPAEDDADKPKELETLKAPVLDYQQFALVADAIRKFDGYLQAINNENEADLAFTYNWRNDHHREDRGAAMYFPSPFGSPRVGHGRGARRGARGQGHRPRFPREETGRTRGAMTDETSSFPEYKPPSQRSSPALRQAPQRSPRGGSFRRPPRSSFPRTAGMGRGTRSRDNVDDQEWDNPENEWDYNELDEYGEETGEYWDDR